GPEATHDHTSRASRLVVNFWLFQNGFSIGIGDTVAGPKGHGLHHAAYWREKQLVVEIIEEAYHDQLKVMPGMTIQESSESKPEWELDRARND
ncbi:hypothetical protein EDB19DRAFT_1646692, partial [Suillus lakei]